MFIQFLILSMFFLASAGTLQSYQDREKSFSEWKVLQEKSELVRKHAAEKQKKERLSRELQSIRRRQQFRREFRTTAHLENDFQKKMERREKTMSIARDVFAQNHRALLNYYDQNILPLKKKEYGLDMPHEGKQ